MSFARLVPVCRLYIQLCIFLDILVHRFTFLVVVSTCLQHTSWLKTFNCKSMSIKIGLAIARDILPGLHKISTYCVFGTIIFFKLSLE